jgi:hypothetical protein
MKKEQANRITKELDIEIKRSYTITKILHNFFCKYLSNGFWVKHIYEGGNLAAKNENS